MTSTFDRLIESYQVRGLSREAAVRAAIGRDGFTESYARERSAQADRLREAEEAAEAAARTPIGPSPDLAMKTVAVAEAARRQLGMDEASARRYATSLQEREMRRGGPEHAARWQEAFAVALSEPARS